VCEVGLKVGLSTLRRRPFCLMCGQPQPANCIIDGYGAVLSGIQTLVSPPLDLDLELSGRLNRAVKALFVIVRNPTYTVLGKFFMSGKYVGQSCVRSHTDTHSHSHPVSRLPPVFILCPGSTPVF
jgi:hypothetical protein